MNKRKASPLVRTDVQYNSFHSEAIDRTDKVLEKRLSDSHFNMDANKVFVMCLNVLRWSGLTFTKAEISSSGFLTATHSKLHFVLNLIIAAIFVLLFFQLKHRDGDRQLPLVMIYPFYVKVIMIIIILFSLCGNVYNRKFAAIINGYKRASGALAGHLPPKRGAGEARILQQFLVFFVGTLCVQLYVDASRTLYFEIQFRIVQYICFIYITFFTAHYAITMIYIKETFGAVNGVLGRIVQRDVPTVAGVYVPVRRRVIEWMKVYMQLREMEPLVNEVFGKQIFLTFILAFSSVIVNAHYLFSANMFGLSYSLLNVTMIISFFQSVVSVLISSKVAELAANEANRVNEVIFGVVVNWRKLKLQNQVRSLCELYTTALHNLTQTTMFVLFQIKYFILFNHRHPAVFRVWIFYELNYNSLFKVMVTSSAITTVLLQFDFLKRAAVEGEGSANSFNNQF